MGRGRSANRIFGNRVFPENGPNQFASGIVLTHWIAFSEESLIGCLQVFLGFSLGANATLRQVHQGTTQGDILLARTASNFGK